MKNRSFVLITNGNAMSMMALGEWLAQYGSGLQKVYITYKLPSTKGNLRGVWDMFCNSGWSYTYMKIWANKILPAMLRKKGLPGNVPDFLRHCGLDVPVQPVASVNAPEILDEIRSLAPDYLISFSATQRFKDNLIELPTKGAINTHYGALPAYAGLSPYYWHLANKEPQFGVTLHQIVSKLDAGPIIEQGIESMDEATTCLDVLYQMACCVSPMLCRFFEGTTGLNDVTPQPTEGRTYFRHPTRGQVAQFKADGFKMMSKASQEKIIERISQLAEM